MLKLLIFYLIIFYFFGGIKPKKIQEEPFWRETALIFFPSTPPLHKAIALFHCPVLLQRVQKPYVIAVSSRTLRSTEAVTGQQPPALDPKQVRTIQCSVSYALSFTSSANMSCLPFFLPCADVIFLLPFLSVLLATPFRACCCAVFCLEVAIGHNSMSLWNSFDDAWPKKSFLSGFLAHPGPSLHHYSVTSQLAFSPCPSFWQQLITINFP